MMAGHRVFSQLDGHAQQALAARFQRLHAGAGEVILAPGQLHTRMGWVIAGAVEMRDPDLGLSVRLGVGELFGSGATPAGQLQAWQASAMTDCEIAFLSTEDLRQTCSAHRALAYFFPSLAPSGPDDGQAGGAPSGDSNLLAMPMRALIKRSPVTLPPEASVRETAELMRSEHVSSVLLVERDHLFGIVTDRDLRNRALAKGMDISRPVADIATLAPMTLDVRSPAFEAQLLMARYNVHHVPVMDGHRVAGMVTATDMTEQHSMSAVYLAGDIYSQTTVEALVQASTRVKQLLRNLAAADASAYSTGRLVTTITDALTTRLLHLAEASLGPAPVDYVWVAAGSQARAEQTAKSDQDNCLVLDDSYDERLHGEYFSALSRYVCDGLDACGYVHCPGKMMAMTDEWRQPRHRWSSYFRKWVDEPEPMALMLTCVFFDLRAIHGNTELLGSLRSEVLQRTRGNSLFLAHMVGNALKHRPPLGLFGNISPARSGENAGTVDLKHLGIVPIVDLARIYALAGAVEAVNTHDRLALAAATGEVTEQGARDLRDALEFMGKLRIQHQARQIQAGRTPDNFLALEELSNLQRSQLKDAFGVVRTLQSVLGQRY